MVSFKIKFPFSNQFFEYISWCHIKQEHVCIYTRYMWNMFMASVMDKCWKHFYMKKFLRVSRPIRAENCPIIFHTEVFEVFFVLKYCHWISLLLYPILKDIGTVITGNSLILRSSVIFDCFGQHFTAETKEWHHNIVFSLININISFTASREIPPSLWIYIMWLLYFYTSSNYNVKRTILHCKRVWQLC